MPHQFVPIYTILYLTWTPIWTPNPFLPTPSMNLPKSSFCKGYGPDPGEAAPRRQKTNKQTSYVGRIIFSELAGEQYCYLPAFLPRIALTGITSPMRRSAIPIIGSTIPEGESNVISWPRPPAQPSIPAKRNVYQAHLSILKSIREKEGKAKVPRKGKILGLKWLDVDFRPRIYYNTKN